MQWLERVAEEGLEKHADSQGNIRPLAMNNTVSAVTEMNRMLGTTEDEEDSLSQPISKVQIEVISANA